MVVETSLFRTRPVLIGQPSTKAFEEGIDPASMQVRHFEVASAY